MANNPYVNKVEADGQTLIDLTSDTAVASDVAQGKYFHLATGERVAGTSSGGGGTEAGTVTQDGDGYLVLDDEAGSGGGLVYEMGTWTPTEDIVRPEIMFSNSHIDMPMFVMLSDVNGDYYSTTYSNLMFLYADWERVFGYPFYVSSTVPQYCFSYNRYRTSNPTSSTATLHMLSNPSTSTSDSSSIYSRYYVKPDRFYPWSTDTAYWRSGRTYKWIAVWAPTS